MSLTLILSRTDESYKDETRVCAGADPDHVQHSIRLGKNFLKINSKINLSLYDNLWRPRLIKSKRPSSPPVASAQI